MRWEVKCQVEGVRKRFEGSSRPLTVWTGHVKCREFAPCRAEMGPSQVFLLCLWCCFLHTTLSFPDQLCGFKEVTYLLWILSLSIKRLNELDKTSKVCPTWFQVSQCLETCGKDLCWMEASVHSPSRRNLDLVLTHNFFCTELLNSESSMYLCFLLLGSLKPLKQRGLSPLFHATGFPSLTNGFSVLKGWVTN